MGRSGRANSFLLEPSRYRNDPAVMAMSIAARGAYSMLFMAGWDLEEPGVYPADDRVLGQLAMATPEEWSAVRSEVALAFDTESRPGYWVQKGLVRTKEVQDRFVASQSRRGKVAAKSRWNKAKDASALRVHRNAHASRITYQGSGSGSGSEKHQGSASPESLPELSVSAQPKVAPSPENGSALPSTGISLPTNRKGESYPVSEAQLAEWRCAFAGVDVPRELRQARAWLDANPSRRKTARGMPAFVVRWLSRAQDRPARASPRDFEHDDPYPESIFQVGEEEMRREPR